MNDTIKNFARTHSIQILDTNKRAYRHTKFNIRYFSVADDYNILAKDTLTFDTEPLYTIEITESELEKIADFENQVFNHLQQYGHYDMFNYLMQQKQREKILKEKYPAVKKAYELYSLMLKLAESGEL
jgi:hypothetical protein